MSGSSKRGTTSLMVQVGLQDSIPIIHEQIISTISYLFTFVSRKSTICCLCSREGLNLEQLWYIFCHSKEILVEVRVINAHDDTQSKIRLGFNDIPGCFGLHPKN
jgi:hypothetical protein